MPEINQRGCFATQGFYAEGQKSRLLDQTHVFSLPSSSSARFVKAYQQHPSHPADPDLPEYDRRRGYRQTAGLGCHSRTRLVWRISGRPRRTPAGVQARHWSAVAKSLFTDLKTDVRRKVVPRLHADDAQVSRSIESVFAAAGLLVAILGGPWTRADE